MVCIVIREMWSVWCKSDRSNLRWDRWPIRMNHWGENYECDEMEWNWRRMMNDCLRRTLSLRLLGHAASLTRIFCVYMSRPCHRLNFNCAINSYRWKSQHFEWVVYLWMLRDWAWMLVKMECLLSSECCMRFWDDGVGVTVTAERREIVLGKSMRSASEQAQARSNTIEIETIQTIVCAPAYWRQWNVANEKRIKSENLEGETVRANIPLCEVCVRSK